MSHLRGTRLGNLSARSFAAPIVIIAAFVGWQYWRTHRHTWVDLGSDPALLIAPPFSKEVYREPPKPCPNGAKACAEKYTVYYATKRAEGGIASDFGGKLKTEGFKPTGPSTYVKGDITVHFSSLPTPVDLAPGPKVTAADGDRVVRVEVDNFSTVK